MTQPQELRAMLEGAGFRPGARIVNHCDGGGCAALAALAAVQAGYTRMDAYYLSSTLANHAALQRA